MGMFDEIKCSANIGELTNAECQTKDIDNVMSFFWVDPLGQLWSTDYSGTQDIHYHKDKPFYGLIDYRPNGNKGKVYRVYLTDYVNIYSGKSTPDAYCEMVTCRLHFIDGVLQSYSYK